jgi:hypothetical protein
VAAKNMALALPVTIAMAVPSVSTGITAANKSS